MVELRMEILCPVLSSEDSAPVWGCLKGRSTLDLTKSNVEEGDGLNI